MATKTELVNALRALGVEISDSKAKKTALAALEQMLTEAQPKVVPMRAAMDRPAKPAEAFRPTAAGSKRDLMAQLVLRPEGATVEDLMTATGWNRSTASSAIVEDLCRGMGLGVRREGSSYFGRLPDGITSHVREVAPVKLAANTSPKP